MKRTDIIGALIAIVICEAAGAIGSLFTIPAIAGWYAGIAKSPLNPPGWLFGPVWAALYALMGIAAFLVWRHGTGRTRPLSMFGIQLVVNVLWPLFFFGAHNPLVAFIDILVLWVLILLTLFSFRTISRAAAWLLAPYLAWVTFAAYLNYAVLTLN